VNWLRRLLGRGATPGIGSQHELYRYRSLPDADLHQPFSTARCVVLDVETSGLDPLRDSLISIGAAVLGGGVLRIAESFEVVLRQKSPSAGHNILVHGIDGTTQTAGDDPAQALLAFLHFAGKAPLVGFHADFDRVVINLAMRNALGLKLVNPWIDLAHVLPALFADRAQPASTLDSWLHIFGIDNHARHNASADAWATAQLLQIALAQAARQGVHSYAGLMRLENGQRWLTRR
jgi:DNA polymerase III subunit epsilon